MESGPGRKASSWFSLLSTLLAAEAEPMDIYLAERAPGDDEWDFAFWQYDPDGIMCAYRCGPNKTIWEPTETPSYTGLSRPWESDESRHGQKPWHGDPDPK